MARISRFPKMAAQERRLPVGAVFGRPAAINLRSSGETHGCCAGVSRAIQNQTEPTARPTAELTQKAARQPFCIIMYAISGEVTAAPNPTPVKMIPFAIPRSAEGTQAATAQFEAG